MTTHRTLEGEVTRLSLVLLAALLAAPGAASGAAERAAPPTLAEVNEALAGRKAVIELADGSRVDGTDVEVGPASTFFVAADGGRQVATAEIVRISVLPKPRLLRGLAFGALAGAVVGALAADSDDDATSGGWFSVDLYSDEYELALSAGLGAGVGAGVGAAIGATAGKHPGCVVYEAPLAAYLEAPSGPFAAAREAMSGNGEPTAPPFR